MAGVMMLSVALAVAGTVGAQGPQRADLGNLDQATRIEIRDSAGSVVLSGNFEIRPGITDDKDARLTGDGDARGEADIDIDGSTEQELEVEVRGLAPNQTYSVWIDDRQVGTFTTDAQGRGDVEWEREG
jgi:hypothetical protein